MRLDHNWTSILDVLRIAWHGKWVLLFSAVLTISQGVFSDVLKNDPFLAKKLGWMRYFGYDYAAYPDGLTVALVVLMIVSAIVLFGILPTYLPIRSLGSAHRPKGSRVLIIPLSPPSSEALSELKGQDIKADIITLGGHNFAQVLRGIEPHLTEASLIWLIGSPDPKSSDSADQKKGSFIYLDQFKAALARYLPNVKIVCEPAPVDFEDVDQLYRTLNRIVDTIVLHKRDRENKTYNEQDIMIDATGGMKTTSIAAAMVTLHNKTSFQYVQTSGDKGVKSFKLIYLPGSARA